MNKIISVFYTIFEGKYHTRLVGGGKEPIYLPSDAVHPYHRIIFTKDYISSALHEASHWCIAGEKRRQTVDYGYWYEPDGRDAEQQVLFESVEVKPQAIEWIFSRAAKTQFVASADNLEESSGPSPEFKQKLWLQVREYCDNGLPKRANDFAHALAEAFETRGVFDINNYTVDTV